MLTLKRILVSKFLSAFIYNVDNEINFIALTKYFDQIKL